MAHQPTRHRLSPDLDDETARAIAATMQALTHPSRLRILAILQLGPATVGRLTDVLDMEQSAVSHQLRLLRELGFVIAERDGRHMQYQLYDDHVWELIGQAHSHADHVRLGVAGDSPAKR